LSSPLISRHRRSLLASSLLKSRNIEGQSFCSRSVLNYGQCLSPLESNSQFDCPSRHCLSGKAPVNAHSVIPHFSLTFLHPATPEQGIKLLGLLLTGSTGQHMAGRNGLA
jgi:hypothetical protein